MKVYKCSVCGVSKVRLWSDYISVGNLWCFEHIQDRAGMKVTIEDIEPKAYNIPGIFAPAWSRGESHWGECGVPLGFKAWLKLPLTNETDRELKND